MTDAALPFLALADDPFWTLVEGAPHAELAAAFHPPALHALLATDRGARLAATQALLAPWLASTAHALAGALALHRTYRIASIAPTELDACLASGTWGARDWLTLRTWRRGDGLLIHVKRGGGICAIAHVLGEAYQDTAPLWQDTPRRVHPWRVRFEVIDRLAAGIPIRQALAPLRIGARPNWAKGFIQSNHVLTADDARALLAAVDTALAALG